MTGDDGKTRRGDAMGGREERCLDAVKDGKRCRHVVGGEEGDDIRL